MKRVGFILKVKQDRLEEYKMHHRNVWPEQLEALRRHGWHNYSLFLRKDGLLFGYFETPESFQAALKGMEKEEVNLKWQEMMKPFFEGLAGSRPDEGMLELEEICHVE
jgi:L-rhamnose mutarotase